MLVFLGVTQAVRIIRIMPEDGKGETIELVQPILGTKPHKPLAILENAKHGALRKALFEGDRFKSEMLPWRKFLS
jgi:hypothetical protein